MSNFKCVFCNEQIEFKIKVMIGTDKGIQGLDTVSYEYEEYHLM